MELNNLVFHIQFELIRIHYPYPPNEYDDLFMIYEWSYSNKLFKFFRLKIYLENNYSVMETLFYLGFAKGVVVVYQWYVSNIMYTGDIEALFVFGSRCVGLLETHPLLGWTFPIITSPWLNNWIGSRKQRVCF